MQYTSRYHCTKLLENVNFCPPYDVESSFRPYYHLYTPHPRSPIAAINAIGISADSDGLLAAVVAGNTVLRP